MIAEIDTFGRHPFNRSREQLLGLRWRCRHCQVQITLSQVIYLYVVHVQGSTLLLSFGMGAEDADLRHHLVHVCGADVDAQPLWERPEWS